LVETEEAVAVGSSDLVGLSMIKRSY